MNEEQAGLVSLNSVSKWYDEVLGVNRITASVTPGFTGLVGPNGSGKSTLMNLICGLIRPSRGSLSVCGVSPDHPRTLNGLIGYVHQFDEVYPQVTAYSYLRSMLRIDGFSSHEADGRARHLISLVKLDHALHQKLGSFSKGMKQRIKVARALARDPQVLILDEPLAGLDPVSRKELSDLFSDYGERGNIVLMSSHILAEIENLTRRVLMLDNGSIVAEGDLDEVRQEMKSIPMQIYLRTVEPALLAATLFNQGLVQSASVSADGKGITIKTDDSDRFLLTLNKLVSESSFTIDFVATIDDSMESIYRYLIYPNIE